MRSRRSRLLLVGSLAAVLVPAVVPAVASDVDFGKCPQGKAAERALEAREKARVKALSPVARVRYPAMQRALIEMVDADRRVREATMVPDASQAALQAMMAVDARHLPLLRHMLAQGFPTPSDVGYDGVSAAWLLVQHADADPALQRRVLDQLSADPIRYAARPEELAMLTDRVLQHEGHPQRYGTQFESTGGGEWQPQPIEHPAGLDVRRAQAGLMPMDVYRCVIAQMYGTSGSDPDEP